MGFDTIEINLVIIIIIIVPIFDIIYNKLFVSP